MTNEVLHGSIIKITSNFPGAGATTAKLNIAKNPHFAALSAGDFRRALVVDWENWKSQDWTSFRNQYFMLWAKGGIQTVLSYLTEKDRLSQTVENKKLTAFNDRAAEDFAPTSNDWKIWDWMTDAYSIYRTRMLLEAGYSVVGEGDLVIATQEIDQLQDESQKLDEAYPTILHSTFCYILSVDRFSGTKRVEQREKAAALIAGREYHALTLMERLTQLEDIVADDYSRYALLYSIVGAPLDTLRYNQMHARAIDASQEESVIKRSIENDVKTRVEKLRPNHPELVAHLLGHLQE
ncbi:MAG: hypothetical protein ABI758_01670 [Candidatus Woesebacteria bacterium]